MLFNSYLFLFLFLPLALLERYTWESGETLSAPIVVANYGKGAIPGPLCWRLEGEGVALGGELPARAFPEGGLTPAGRIDIPLSFVARPTRLELALEAGETVNRYPLWVYPRVEPCCPEGVVAADSLAGAKAALEAGRRVFLAEAQGSLGGAGTAAYAARAIEAYTADLT